MRDPVVASGRGGTVPSNHTILSHGSCSEDPTPLMLVSEIHVHTTTAADDDDDVSSVRDATGLHRVHVVSPLSVSNGSHGPLLSQQQQQHHHHEQQQQQEQPHPPWSIRSVKSDEISAISTPLTPYASDGGSSISTLSNNNINNSTMVMTLMSRFVTTDSQQGRNQSQEEDPQQVHDRTDFSGTREPDPDDDAGDDDDDDDNTDPDRTMMRSNLHHYDRRHNSALRDWLCSTSTQQQQQQQDADTEVTAKIRTSQRSWAGAGGGGGGDGDDAAATALEVLYSDGATPLFLAIEDADWTLALRHAERDPNQARTWVTSTGTAYTTFDWSLWRRLPLHEACRRQAPAWFVSTLLTLYPAACRMKTQFGELPLHLAVECGASPEVVNLVTIAYWRGIAEPDQSGRTPMEILQDSEILDLEDHKHVYESIQRSYASWLDVQAEHASVVQDLQLKHTAGLIAIKQQHDEDLALEQDQQNKLLDKIERLQWALDASKPKHVEQQAAIDTLTADRALLRTNADQLKQALEGLQKVNQQQKTTITNLEHTIHDRNHEVGALRDRVDDLQTALQRLCSWHKGELQRKLDDTQESMRLMVGSFVEFQDLLNHHSDDLTGLMDAMGVEEEEENDEIPINIHPNENGGGDDDGDDDASVEERHGRSCDHRAEERKREDHVDDDDGEDGDDDDDHIDEVAAFKSVTFAASSVLAKVDAPATAFHNGL